MSFQFEQSQRGFRKRFTSGMFPIWFKWLLLSFSFTLVQSFQSNYSPYTGSSLLETTIQLPPIQFQFPPGEGADFDRRQQVQDVIKRTWDLYVQQAWGWDEVRPVRGSGQDTLNGWGATIIDGLDTLFIAGLNDEFLSALNFSVSVDFTSADGLVDPFETIIRYVAGLVSTCDLLEYSGSSINSTAIVQQAKVLTGKLAPGLDTPTKMWFPNIDFFLSEGVSSVCDDTLTTPADTGSNILEYGRLSELTVDVQYINNATAAWWLLVQPINESVLPGMVASPISVITGESATTGSTLQWGGGQDSFYEYLIKSFILWPNSKTTLYRDRWLLAVEGAMQNLSSWSLPTQLYPSFRYLAILNDGVKTNEMEHLTCFAAGNFLLGGRALGRDDIFEFGLDIMEGCWHAYNATPTGIAPEIWQWISNDTSDRPCSQVFQQWDESALWSIDGNYLLRPEVMESYFYAYRTTGDKIWQDRAWEAFQHITGATLAPYGYTAINDVMRIGGSNSNDQESFWLAETLKYLYLIFDSPDNISLDEWVFNTEAHPLRRGRQVDWNN